MDSCLNTTWHFTNSSVLSDNGLKPSLIQMTYLTQPINNSVKLSLRKESQWRVQGEETQEEDKTLTVLYNYCACWRGPQDITL